MSHFDANAHRHFLLVEDFEAMRGVLKGQLLRCGATRVDAAAHGAEAAALLRKHRYDVVLCDYNLGAGRNGQQLLEEARLHGWIQPSTVWLMITAEKTNDMVSVAAEDAPDDYLLKPITEGALQTRLDKLMKRKASLVDIADAMARRDWPEALRCCQRELAEGTRCAAEVLRLQAQVHQRMGQWQKAREVYDSVLARGPIPWARLGLAKVCLQQKNTAAARNILAETVRDHPQYLEAYDCLAELYRTQGALPHALAVLERAAAISPNSPSRQAALGTAAMQQGKAEVAAEAFRRSIKLSEFSAVENTDAYVGMARVHTEAGAPAEALKVLAALGKRHDSRNAQLLGQSEMVRALHASGDAAGAAERAAALLTRAQDGAAPVPADTSMRIAEALMASGQADSATALLEFVACNNHDDEDLIRRAQAVFDGAGLGERGLALLSAARRQATEAMSEGVALLGRGDLQGALDSLRGAMRTMSQNARVMFNFAAVAITAMEKNGWSVALEEEARAAITSARTLRPDDTRGTDLLARLARLAAPAA